MVQDAAETIQSADMDVDKDDAPSGPTSVSGQVARQSTKFLPPAQRTQVPQTPVSDEGAVLRQNTDLAPPETRPATGCEAVTVRDGENAVDRVGYDFNGIHDYATSADVRSSIKSAPSPPLSALTFDAEVLQSAGMHGSSVTTNQEAHCAESVYSEVTEPIEDTYEYMDPVAETFRKGTLERKMQSGADGELRMVSVRCTNPLVDAPLVTRRTSVPMLTPQPSWAQDLPDASTRKSSVMVVQDVIRPSSTGPGTVIQVAGARDATPTRRRSAMLLDRDASVCHSNAAAAELVADPTFNFKKRSSFV